jgi:hypothetical protein
LVLLQAFYCIETISINYKRLKKKVRS